MSSTELCHVCRHTPFPVACGCPCHDAYHPHWSDPQPRDYKAEYTRLREYTLGLQARCVRMRAEIARLTGDKKREGEPVE